MIRQLPQKNQLSDAPPPPAPSNHNYISTNAWLTIAVGTMLVFMLACVCKLSHQNRDGAEAAPPSTLVQAVPPPEPWGNDSDSGGEGRPRRASPTAGLPSFKYNRSVKRKARGGGGGDEAPTTCSVCLGAFQAGETVRLLPVCLHLYHVECIDPWLDKHSTCPICRSGTDPTTDGLLYPPV